MKQENPIAVNQQVFVCAPQKLLRSECSLPAFSIDETFVLIPVSPANDHTKLWFVQTSVRYQRGKQQSCEECSLGMELLTLDAPDIV